MDYYWNGTQLLAQKTGNTYLHFLYDETGSAVGYKYNNKTYIYVKNLQGDVTSVIDGATGTAVATYTYDSWGNILTATGAMAEVNPIRYRGYYYDTDTSLYYLQSRYYDAQTHRFVNADAILTLTILGLNAFSYCGNNPVSNSDSSGYCRVRFDGVVIEACNNITCSERVSMPDIKNKKVLEKVMGDSNTDILCYAMRARPFKIDHYEIRNDPPHGNGTNAQRHVHIKDEHTGKVYSQNEDGSFHDEGKHDGTPPKTLRDKLKKSNKKPWDWDKKRQEYEERNQVPKFAFDFEMSPNVQWEDNYDNVWATGDSSFWDIINPFKKR